VRFQNSPYNIIRVIRNRAHNESLREQLFKITITEFPKTFSSGGVVVACLFPFTPRMQMGSRLRLPIRIHKAEKDKTEKQKQKGRISVLPFYRSGQQVLSLCLTATWLLICLHFFAVKLGG